MSEQTYSDRAELYSAAFSWDCSAQAGAILGGCTHPVQRVLEPMCGHGRLLRAFGELGLELVGVDRSPRMIDIARRELAAYPNELICGDVIDVELDAPADLAVCPVNSIAYFDAEQLSRHLATMGRNLKPGHTYWIQLDLRTPEQVKPARFEGWEFAHGVETLICEWHGESSDGEWETQVSRFIHPDGTVVEDRHQMKIWTWQDFADLVEASPFQQIAAWDNDVGASLSVGPDLQDTPLTWHQLRRQ